MYIEFEGYIARYLIQRSQETNDRLVSKNTSILTEWIKAGIIQYEKDTGYRFNIE